MNDGNTRVIVFFSEITSAGAVRTELIGRGKHLATRLLSTLLSLAEAWLCVEKLVRLVSLKRLKNHIQRQKNK